MSTSRSVALSLVIVVDAALLCGGAHAQAGPVPSITVALQVVPKDDLSGIAWTAMTKEARTIWAREGVELIRDAADTAATLRLPVSFDDRTLRSTSRRDRPRSEWRSSPAGASKSSFRCRARATWRRPRPAMSWNRTARWAATACSGVLLGRVLAHEIGHALLVTKGHSAYGLMSGNIMPREATLFPDDRLAQSIHDEIGWPRCSRKRRSRREGLPMRPDRGGAERGRVDGPAVQIPAARSADTSSGPSSWTARRGRSAVSGYSTKVCGCTHAVLAAPGRSVATARCSHRAGRTAPRPRRPSETGWH